MNIYKTIKDHCENRKFARITRRRGEFKDISGGYILSYSQDFILLQETNDFAIVGYNIIPINTIKKIRHNKYDKFYDKIIHKEKIIKKVGLKWDVDLTSWKSIFESILKTKLNVIIECEEPQHDIFYIGALRKIKNKSVAIQHFNAEGFWDDVALKQTYDEITKVTFDDRYINVFSKYLKEAPIGNTAKKSKK